MTRETKTHSALRNKIARECACFNLRKAARAATSLFDEALKPCGLYATQFTVLTAIADSEPATITLLSQALIMDRTTLTRNLNPLQKKGWVEIRPGEDKRTRVLTLTDSGRKILDEAVGNWERAQDNVVRTLGKKNWAELRENLSVVVEKLNPY